MPLQNTGLLIQMAPLPATFKGSPQEWAEEMVRRFRIVSPTGTNFIFIGDVEPSSNAGPWLRGGTQWWVFDPGIKRYVPLDISESERLWFQVGNSIPATGDPAIWLKTTKDQTEADPSIGRPISWYAFDGTNWVSSNGIVLSGPTSTRPAAPENLQQYYDTDISVLIWFERGQWRTVSGVVGDIKHVAYQTLAEALLVNPGWEYFGESNTALRGRYFSGATKDSGASPVTVKTVGAGIAEHGAFETYGDGTQTDSSTPIPLPSTVALWQLVKL